jgi:hypothetical protein
MEASSNLKVKATEKETGKTFEGIFDLISRKEKNP